MSIDNVLDLQFETGGERCAVCGKATPTGTAHARIRHGENMVALCCPLCLETFQRNPDDYARRQETRDEVRSIHQLLKSRTPPGGSEA